MATIPITTRIPDWIDREVRAYWKKQGEKPSPGYRRAIEEWWITQTLPLLEFRNSPSGRRAAVRGGPDVWEIAMIAREYQGNVQRLEEHFGGYLSREALDQALRYAERFPETIEAQLAENARVEDLLAESRD
jgi:hypothetical protein